MYADDPFVPRLNEKLKPFLVNAPVLYTLKTSKNSSVVWGFFRGYKMGRLVINELSSNIFLEKNTWRPLFDIHNIFGTLQSFSKKFQAMFFLVENTDKILERNSLTQKSEVAVRRCSSKYVFLKISQNSQENTWSSFNTFTGQKGLPVNFAKIFRKTFFTEHLLITTSKKCIYDVTKFLS